MIDWHAEWIGRVKYIDRLHAQIGWMRLWVGLAFGCGFLVGWFL